MCALEVSREDICAVPYGRERGLPETSSLRFVMFSLLDENRVAVF